MLRRIIALLGTLALFAAASISNAETLSNGLNAGSMARARDAVLPHVVSILVVRKDFAAGESRLSLSGGTGTIVSADGYVATNAHVTDNGARFRVVLNDQREFPATLIGTDPISDLAVLKLKAPAGTRFGFAQFAQDLSALRPGDTVLAMGAPWGMRDSVSAGVINHVSRLMVSLFEDEADYEQALNETQSTARYYAWIQHDASISPGNSGGPLVDLRGQIVGVNTRGSAFGGDMAFSIPAPIARDVIQKLITDGVVKRSDFGFNVRSLRGTGLPAGALISSVDRESDADKAGMKPGDLLLAIDGKSISLLQPEDVPEFRRQLGERPVGQSLRLTIQRQGKTQQISVRSKLQNDQKPIEQEVPHWGISITAINDEIARARYLDGVSGVLVSGLRTGGPAGTAQPPLQTGDRITHVNRVAVKDSADFLSKAGKLPNDDENPSEVTIEFDRSGQKLIALLVPAPKRVIPPINPELSKAWAGWDVQPIPGTLARQLKLAEPGFRVVRVFPHSPAEKAGIVVGDLIVATNDIAVKPSGLKETSALDLRVRNAMLSEPFKVSILKSDGKRVELALQLIETPTQVEKAERRWSDLMSTQLRELTYFDRIARHLTETQNGVMIERVENGGHGGLAHLREGDLLVRVLDVSITDIDSLERALADAQAKNVAKLSFLVMRGADTRLLFVDSPWLAQ